MPNTNEIALQNDNFRKHLSQGTLVLTQGIRSNTKEDLEAIITKVRTFDTFDENTHPHGERDFGAFDYKGKRLFRKIDYSDQKSPYLWPDVSNPSVTNRALTIMYAEEY